MERIPIDEVRFNFDQVVELVARGKRRLLVRSDLGDHAGLISLEDLVLLETLDGKETIPVERVPMEEVRRYLREDIEEVTHRKERIVLLRGKEELAALVPRRDLKLLETLDARLDMEAAKRILDQQLRDELED